MQTEHAGWFQPGSISLSFLVFIIAAAVMAGIVGGLVRYLSQRKAAQHH